MSRVSYMHVGAPLLLSALVCLCFSRGLAAADSKTAPANLSAAQVVEKHVAARGGQQAWRALQTLSVTGKMDAGYGDSAERSRRLAEGGLGASVKRAHANTVVADLHSRSPNSARCRRPRARSSLPACPRYPSRRARWSSFGT